MAIHPRSCCTRLFAYVFGLVWLASIGASASAADAAFDHSDWTQVLERFVDDRGLVDYQALAKDRATFDRYLARIQKTSPDSDPGLFPTKDHELAYWINAYNAQVFKGVLDRGPEQDSVWSGGLISGRKFFVSTDIVVGGKKTNLKSLEDDIVRDRYQDPRIHAALNCASISCPRLPRQAFTGAGLQQELDAAMTEFVNDPRNVSVDKTAGKVELSKIFDWFGKDFFSYEKRQGNNDPELVDYINRYRDPAKKLSRDLSLDFFGYDKGINAQR